MDISFSSFFLKNFANNKQFSENLVCNTASTVCKTQIEKKNTRMDVLKTLPR